MATGISDFENQLKNSMSNSFSEVQSSISNQQMNTTITETMRSFKDQMSFNLQSLNLTLSTLSSSMNNLGSKIGGLTPNISGRYIESGLEPGAFLGNISRNYANAQGNYLSNLSPILGNSAFVNRPFNIAPMEFYTGVQNQRDFYTPKLLANALSGVISAITPGTTLTTMALGGFWQGTHGYMDTGDMLRRMSGRFTSGGFNQNSALQVAKGIQRLNYNELMTSTSMDNRLGYSGFRDIAALGLQSDMFHGKTPEDLLKQIKEAGKVVKFLTGVLGNQDVKEAMQSLTQLKNMGINLSQAGGSRFARALVQNSFGFGYSNGMTSGQMLNTGMQVAQAGLGTNGIPAAIGVQQGMKNLAYISEMRKRGLISDVDISAGGGEQSIAARMMSVSGTLLNSGLGYNLLAAGMNGTRFDADKALTTLQKGGIASIVGGAINNLMSGSGFFSNSAKMMVNRNDLLASLVQQDPNALDNLTAAGIKMQMRFNPLYNRGNIQDKMYMIAQHLMLNQGLDAGSAKMIASRLVDPSLKRETDYFANIATSRAEIDRGRVYNSFGAQLGRAIVDPIERLGQKMIVQPFVNLGEEMVNFSKRREQYADVAGAVRTGTDLIYDREKDEKGNYTGLKTLNLEKLHSTLSRGFKDYKDSRIAEDEINSQVIRAQNNITNGGQGTLFRSLAAKTWNKAGQILSLGIGQDFVNDEKVYAKMLNKYKRTYKNEFNVIDEGAGLDGANALSDFIDSKLGKNTYNKTLTDEEVTEIAKENLNNPIAYGMELARQMGAKSSFSTNDWNNVNVDSEFQNKANKYLTEHESSFQNTTAFSEKDFAKDYTGYLSYVGAKTFEERKRAAAAFLKAKTANGFSGKETAERYGMETFNLFGTQAGNAVISSLGTNTAATANWQLDEFFHTGNAALNTDDVFSTKAINKYELMKANGYNEDMGKLFAYLSKNQDKISQQDWLTASPEQRRRIVKKATGLNGLEAAKLIKDVAKLQTAVGNGNFEELSHIINVGTIDAIFKTASASTGGVLDTDSIRTGLEETGSLGGSILLGMLANGQDFIKNGVEEKVVKNAQSGYKKLSEKYRITDETTRNDIFQAATAKGPKEVILPSEKEGEAGKKVEVFTREFEHLKKAGLLSGNGEYTTENIEKAAKMHEESKKLLLDVETNTFQKQISDEQTRDSNNQEALKKSVKSAIDSTVATVNGVHVVQIVNATDYLDDMQEKRKLLGHKIEQVSAANLGLIDKLLGASNKVQYKGDDK